MTIHKPAPYQRNAWYAASLGADVTEQPLRRLIMNEPVVLFRTSDGLPAALEDRCCHRLAPLSPGQLIADEIECPYHGLRFDRHGHCTHVPGQTDIPRRACVQSYPLAERYGFVWIWMGNPDRADLALLPDWHWAEDDAWTSLHGAFHIDCHYMLSIDNLMDLSHIGYVHKTTIGSASDGEMAQVNTLSQNDRVTVRRWVPDQPPSPTYRKKLGSADPIDRWQLIEFQPPCYIRTFKGLGHRIHGKPGYDFTSADSDPPEGALSVSRGNTCVTPETDASCHYFTVHCHYRETDKDMLDMIWRQTVETLNQDIEILKLTQENMETKPDASMVFIHVDEGVEKARQLARLAARQTSGI